MMSDRIRETQRQTNTKSVRQTERQHNKGQNLKRKDEPWLHSKTPSLMRKGANETQRQIDRQIDRHTGNTIKDGVYKRRMSLVYISRPLS